MVSLRLFIQKNEGQSIYSFDPVRIHLVLWTMY